MEVLGASTRAVAPRAMRARAAGGVRVAAAAAVTPRRAAASPFFRGSLAPLAVRAHVLRRTRGAALAGAQAVLADKPGSAQSGEERFKAWESSFANRHRRTDIKRIMILGAGPIVIGQVRSRRRGKGSGVQLLGRPPAHCAAVCVADAPSPGVRVRLLRHAGVQGAEARARTLRAACGRSPR